MRVMPVSRVPAWLACTVVAASTLLVGCGSSKPKPAPLESLSPVVKLQVAWSQRFGAPQGPSTLTLVDDQLAVANGSGDVFVVDAATGHEQWRAQARADIVAGAGFDGRRVAVVTASNDLMLFDQGKLLWSERQPGRVLTAPYVAGERVFVQALDRSVRAYDVLDGRWLWQYQRPGGEALTLAANGAVGSYRDTLLVGQGARLVGLDPTQGNTRFDISLGTPRGTNEVERLADLVGPLARVHDVVCTRAFQLTVSCIDVRRGAVRWSRNQAGTQAVGANEQLVVGADGADRLTAWHIDSGDLAWRADRFTYRELGAPAVWGDLVAVTDAEGYLHILAAADGRTVGRMELDSSLAAAPVVTDSTLYLFTRKGTVYALRRTGL